jgi:hypothetical protein
MGHKTDLSCRRRTSEATTVTAVVGRWTVDVGPWTKDGWGPWDEDGQTQFYLKSDLDLDSGLK